LFVYFTWYNQQNMKNAETNNA
ncbi:unnamed protein product, partial [Rotaria magnacalcarata]